MKKSSWGGSRGGGRPKVDDTDRKKPTSVKLYDWQRELLTQHDLTPQKAIDAYIQILMQPDTPQKPEAKQKD